MAYAHIDELYRDMARIYVKMNSWGEVQEILKNIGQACWQIFFPDLDGWTTESVEDGRLRFFGGRAGEAPLRQTMDSDSFDKVMSGATEPMELAMAGKITFEGEFWRVMLLRPLLPFMIKAYREVRAEACR